MKCKEFSRILLFGLTLLISNLLYPQALQHAVHGTGIEIETETSPTDDAVLSLPPEQLSLLFPRRVRLVKLTLRNERRDWVDISFRYDPIMNDNFVWNLPRLQSATYYTADWAILAANEQLIRGSFSFAFGPEAKPPSVIKATEELLQEPSTGDPSLRSVTPPPTEIIINREPRRYDPPFTIKLDDADKPDQT